MNGDTLDPETLAELLDGKLAEDARADALRAIAHDRDAYETFVDAATAIHELAPTEPPHFPDNFLTKP